MHVIDQMGGSSVDDDWDFPCLSNGARTIVLLGATGNGKSATGNSIIGRKCFKSRAGSAGVTRATEMQSTVLENGQVINVIDTIGLFDPSAESESIGKEILKCIDLAKDGIHALLLVFSVRGRFHSQEAKVLQNLQTFFGPKITDYMIVVFTGGDDLEDDQTLDDYLGQECPESLQNILDVCKNRCVLFDNKTKDRKIVVQQREKLLELIERVMEENIGRPYTDTIFKEVKKAVKLRQQEENVDLQGGTTQQIADLREQMHKSHDEQLKRIVEMVESRLKETAKRLEEQLAEEQAARLRAEEKAYSEQRKSNEEIRKLRENLEKAQKETEELRNAAANGKCSIL